jgi:hypothetical protein
MVVLPVRATASPGYEVHPGGIRLVLPVQHSGQVPPEHNGDYVIAISANDRRHVQLSVETPSSRTEYSTIGRASGSRLIASFGTLGRVDLRLHLTPRAMDVHTGGRCKGHVPLYMEGTYSGTIAFAPVDSLPRLSVKRGHVYFTHQFEHICKRRRPSPLPSNETTLAHKADVGFLAVHGRVPGRTVSLEGSVLTLKGHPAHTTGRLIVVTRKGSEGVRVTKTTNLPLSHDSFAMSELGIIPETVELAPPMPFAGRALYVRSPGSSPSWTGDLRLSLSDSDRLSLTGPSFSATMCRSSWLNRFTRCRVP